MTEWNGRDNAADRAIGEVWERHFCRLAAWYGKTFLAVQINRRGAARTGGRIEATLPDVQIFTDGGEWHEVKHKNPTSPRRSRDRQYGWESYRLKAAHKFHLESRHTVQYTIHDWEAAGKKAAAAVMPNLLQDWRTVDIQLLVAKAHELRPELVDTWLNGKRAQCPAYYWPITLWERLDLYWGLPR